MTPCLVLKVVKRTPSITSCTEAFKQSSHSLFLDTDKIRCLEYELFQKVVDQISLLFLYFIIIIYSIDLYFLGMQGKTQQYLIAVKLLTDTSAGVTDHHVQC